MREWLTVPAQRTLLTPEGLTAAVTYATEKRHYVQTQLHYDALWSVSLAKLWIGDTERAADAASDDEQLGRTEVVRVNQTKYGLRRYPALTSTGASGAGYAGGRYAKALRDRVPLPRCFPQHEGTFRVTLNAARIGTRTSAVRLAALAGFATRTNLTPNHKRSRRIYREERLPVRPRKKRRVRCVRGNTALPVSHLN